MVDQALHGHMPDSQRAIQTCDKEIPTAIAEAQGCDGEVEVARCVHKRDEWPVGMSTAELEMTVSTSSGDEVCIGASSDGADSRDVPVKEGILLKVKLGCRVRGCGRCT